VSKQTVNQVIQRAVSDAAFRRQLQRDPSGALAGFDLTKDERSAITSGDPTRLTSFGIDQRMSKAFVIGGMGEANKMVVGDASASSTGVLVDESGLTGHGALIDDGAASGHGALIDDGAASGHGALLAPDGSGASAVIVGDPVSPNVAAIDSVDTTGDLNTIDAGLPGGETSAFEPTSTSGDLNVLDAGTLGGGSTSAVGGDDLGTTQGLDDASGGLDTGGDIRPTEY